MKENNQFIRTSLALIALAFILIISIVLRYTGAADVSTSAEIQNTAPTVDTIRFATSAYGADDLTTSGILPNIGVDRTIHVNGQITDLNGENDIASSTLSLVFFRTSKGNTCTADKNDCYTVNTCATTYTDGDNTQITYNCEVPLAYWVDGTDSSSIYESDNWSAYVTVSDTAGLSAASTGTIEMNSLLALNLPDDIDYGTRSLAEVSSSTTNIETILTQRGNTKADVEVLGTTMSCSSLGTLPIDAQAWSLTDTEYASATTLTGSFVPTLRNINLRTDDANELSANLYWNIAIPATGVKGTCTGSNTIVIVAQPNEVVGNGVYGKPWKYLATAHSGTFNETSWLNTGSSLPAPLYGSQTIFINDFIYLFGGINSNGDYTNVIYRAPLANPTAWVDTGATLPANVAGAQAIIVGDYVYLLGGEDASNFLNTIFRAPITDPTSWVNTGATLPSGLTNSQAAVIGGYVYLFGGSTGGSSFDMIYRASITDPTAWVDTGATLPGNTDDARMAVIGDYVYLFGGANQSSFTKRIQRAPLTNPLAWVDTGAVLPGNPVESTQLAVIGQNVYLFGRAYDGEGFISFMYRANVNDPTTWVDTGNPPPLAFRLTQAAVVGDNLYILGGRVLNSSMSTIYRATITP